MEELHSFRSSSGTEQDIAGTFGASRDALYAAGDQKNAHCSEKAGVTMYKEECLRPIDSREVVNHPKAEASSGLKGAKATGQNAQGMESPVLPECGGVRNEQSSRRR